MKTCKACGAQNGSRATTCSKCGAMFGTPNALAANPDLRYTLEPPPKERAEA